MRCTKCGSELEKGARFCGVCGHSVEEDGQPAGAAPEDMNAGTSGYKPAHQFRAVNRMPDGIALGTDERIVRQYRIGRYTLWQGNIEVIVTNKRVIRYEESSLFGMKNNRIDEVNIDSVHGVSTDMRRSISPMGILAGLLVIVLGFVLKSVLFVSGLLGLVFGALIIFNSFRPTLNFRLHGSVGGDILDTSVNDKGRFLRFGNGTTPVFQFHPTEETTVMLKEIGAVMYDLKTLGDAAIPRWT